MASDALRLSTLEQRYIQLLEQRIADLEAKVSSRPAPDSNALQPSGGTAAPQSQARQTTVSTETQTQTEDEETDPYKDIRHLVVLNALDQDTGEYVDRLPAAVPKPAKEAAKSNRAFTFRKFMRTQAIRGEEVVRSNGSEVDIESEPLQKLLAKATWKFVAAAKITQMDSPFQNLIWSWDEADALTKPQESDTDEDKQARIDLKALMDIITKSSGDESLDRYFRNKQSMKESRTVTFDALWTLFPKGSLILSRPFLNLPQVFRVQSCRMPNMEDTDPSLSVIAYSYDWDGTSFNRVPYELTINSFTDKKGIFELPFYPLSEHRNVNRPPSFFDDPSDDPTSPTAASDAALQDVQDLKAKLIARGKKCYEYCVAEKGHQTFRYEGVAFHQPGGGLFRADSYDDDSDSISGVFGRSYSGADEQVSTAADSTSYLKGVVVIDFNSYFQYQPSLVPLGNLKEYDGPKECSCAECRRSFEEIFRYSWDGSNRRRRTPLTDEQYMMLPPRVLGYALAQKQWVQLQVDLVKVPGAADTTNFKEKLILSEENKALISKAVLAHGKANITDYIPGKGKGLVILLWGVPGVGKTLTAESVAALAGKPLFSIGVADIGTQSTRVEANLQRVFALAGQWQAVLLFDEADVFLEARDARGSDMQRNTMVSVLLRILEYYDGILILTTNRLKTFDIAVQSRIHIAIEYNDLDQGQRAKIFTEFLNQLKSKNLVDEYEECLEWVREDGCTKYFNGRQIRNVVSTAMGLAHAEKRGLCRRHLIHVSRNTEIFKRALSDQEAIFRNAQIQPQWR